MEVCHTNINLGFNFMEQCLKNSSNSWLNGTEYFEKDVEKKYKNNGFLLIVVFILTLLLDSGMIKKMFQPDVSNKINTDKIKTKTNKFKKILTLFFSLIILIITPLILIIFSTCFLYQTMVQFLLKQKFGKKYIGLLEGTDKVWAVEDVSKCIINTLAIINIDNIDIDEFRDKFIKRLTETLEDTKFAKMKYFRKKSYGYYFWTKENFDVANYVTYLNEINCTEEYLNKEKVLQLTSEYCNKLLPENHTTSWEILIGKQRVQINKENGKYYPVLFRFHHSIGDGIALIKLLLQAADGDKIQAESKNELKSNNKLNKTLMTVMRNKLHSFFQTVLFIVFAPGHLLQMNLIQTVDNNILHGKQLTGEKTLAWLPEDKDFPILQTIKNIKMKFPNVSFLDVVLTALSEAFFEYFAQKTTEIPRSVTTIVLERADKIFRSEYSPNDTPGKLENRFSVGMMNLPIIPLSLAESGTSPGDSGVGSSDTGRGSDLGTLLRLQEVNRATLKLKTVAPDYKINYWLLTVVSKLLPVPILRPFLQSAHSTMVVSNIVGPNKITICNGHVIEDFIFWVPHRTLTGIGVSILSYSGKLEIGLSADKALIPNSKDAELILLNFVKSLKLFNDELNKETGQKKKSG